MSLFEQINGFVKKHYPILLIFVFILAVFMRLLYLNQPSLSDVEARLALQSLSLSNNHSTLIGGQPSYTGLTSFLFFLFGGSEFLARFWPAIFGAGLVLVPALYYKQLEKTAILVLSFLFALEPGLVALSRTANGMMISITSLLAATGFFLNRKMIPAGILFGLALCSSEQFWPMGIAIGVSWLILFKSFKQNGTAENVEYQKKDWWNIGISAFITIVLICTQFFTNPNGISGIGTGISDYFRSWTQPGTNSIATYLLIFVTTQLPAILFGVWGLVKGLIAKSKITQFLGLWWGLGLISGILNPSLNVWTIVLFDIPLFVLAALQLKSFLEILAIRSKIVTLIEAVITVSLFIFSSLNLLNMVNSPQNDPLLIRNQIIGTFLPLVLWIAFTALLAWGWDMVSTRSGLMIGIGLLFFGLLIGSGWKAASLGSRPENEFFANPGFVIGKTDLFQTISDISRWNNGQSNRIDVDIVGLDSPSINWAFRDFEKISSDVAFPINNNPSIVITSMESLIQSQSIYRGQAIIWSKQPDFNQMVWEDWLKWTMLRKIPQQEQKIILWVRNDLFKDVSTQQQGQ